MGRDEVLAELRRALELPDLAFNKHHVCRLVFDGRLPIDVESLPESGVLHLHAVVGHANSLDLGRARELLSANLFGYGTAGATLGLDEQREEILLFRTYALDTIDPQRLIRELVEFVAAAEMWCEQLASASPATTETVTDSSTAVRV
jgi:hypothetical protein